MQAGKRLTNYYSSFVSLKFSTFYLGDTIEGRPR
ncbi:hypothetical protein [Klebsiella phage pKP-M186-2.1]|nr:hypothetical protein [Klebsiella phage pKP-M186-2.1]